MESQLPDYVLDPSPLAMFTRLQRVGLHLERLQEEAMEEIGMTFADYTVLATLYREAPSHALPVSHLAELVLRPMGSITSVVDRLEGAGLVARRVDRDDRRKILIELTRSGVEISERGDAAYSVCRTRVLDTIDAAELAAIDSAVGSLLHALEADHSAASRIHTPAT